MGMTGEQAYVLAKKLIEAGGGGGGTVNAYTKTQVDNLLFKKADKEAVNELLTDIVTIEKGETQTNYNVMQLLEVSETTKSGITYSVIDDEIHINGTATAPMDFAISSPLPDGTYIIAYEIVSGSFTGYITYTDNNQYKSILINGQNFTIASATRSKLSFASGFVADNLVLHVWANSGDTLYPYQKYGEEIVSESVVTLNDNVIIPNFENKVLDAIGYTQEDTTFDEEIEDTVSKTFNNSNGQCLRFAYISDTHTYPNYDEEDSSTKQYKAEIEHIKAVNDSIPFDFLLHCGDFVNTQWLWKYHTTTDSEYQKMVHDYCNELQNSGIKNIFTTMGNHDGGFIPNESAVGTEYSSYKANFRATQQQNTNSVKVVRNGINPYYYVDYDNLKLRCLFISTDMDSNTSDWKGIQYSEAVWIKNVLESLDADWNVLMFGHIPLNRWYTKNSGAGSTQAFIDICNGFCNHTTVDLSGTALDCDFTSKTGKILAYICGHYHGDSIVLPDDENSVLEFAEVTIASGSYLGKGVITTGDWYDLADAPSDRTYGTINQDAWDSVVYNKTENKIYFTRFGAGVDRVLDLSYSVETMSDSTSEA